MTSIIGKYDLVESKNFDEYMEAVGVGYVTRKMASALKPSTEITKDGDTYSIKTISTFKTTEIKFKLGEKFNEETADGRKCESVITLEGENKLKHNQLCNGEDLVMFREFTPEGMTITLHHPKVTSTRVYKRSS